MPGGGRILYVEKERSCGVNILKSHCTSPSYYHICTRSRSILAQCGSGRIFDSRLQRCVTNWQSSHSDDQKHYDQNSIPECTIPGRFSVPSHCSVFYTCNMRLYRSVYKCPRSTGFYADKGICVVMPGCENDDAVDYAICVPDAPDENLEAENPEETAAEETMGTSKEQETINVSDPAIQRVQEDEIEEERNITPEMDDDAVSTIPEDVTSNPRLVEENDDDGMNSAFTQPIEDVSVTESIEPLYKSYAPITTAEESLVSPELVLSTVSLPESPGEADSNTEVPSRIVNDEQQDDVTSDVSIDPSPSYITDPSPTSQTESDISQMDYTTQVVARDSASSTDEKQVYDASSLEIPETTLLPMEDVPVAPGDAEETSILQASNPVETAQEEALDEDRPPVSPVELYDDAAHSVVSAIPATEYDTNADVDSNVDIATTDTSLLPSVGYNPSPELDEETDSATIVQRENDDSVSSVPLSPSAEGVDQDPASSSDDASAMIPSDLNSDDSDTMSPTSAPEAIFSSEPLADVPQQSTEDVLVVGTSAPPESELAEANERPKNVSSRLSPPDAEDSYLTPTEASLRDLPAASDTDFAAQKDQVAEEHTAEALLAPSAD